MSVPSGPDVAALVKRLRWRASNYRAPWLNEVADALEAVEQERARLQEALEAVGCQDKIGCHGHDSGLAGAWELPFRLCGRCAALSPEGNQ